MERLFSPSMKKIFFLILILLVLPGQTLPSEIKADEEILLFPSYACLQENRGIKITFHVWVYEPDANRVKRKALEEGLERIIKSDMTRRQKLIFNRRIKQFLVDNERNKKIEIWISGRKYRLGRTQPGGHLYSGLVIDDKRIRENLLNKKRIPYRIRLPKNETRKFSGFISFIPNKGVSVISDIDDTIKISNVLNKKELMRNTFLREFQPVSGIPSLYNRWEKKGAVFHYVSGSPWQLYPPILQFLERYSFPRGFFSLKSLRLKPSGIYTFIKADQLTYKKQVIEGIIKNFPERKFILVGDSGEKDPEVYSKIARKFPKRILFILIRNVGNLKMNSPRLKENFPGDFPVRWKIFKDVSELKERYLFSF
jgi:phosphatidate phosphatase APP1